MEHGGKREGAGKKAIDGAILLQKVTVTLTTEMVDRCLAAGSGNLSLGVRKLLDAGTRPIQPSAGTRPKQLPAGRPKRQPLSEDEFVRRALLAREINTPSLTLSMKLRADYQDYLQNF